MDRDSVRGWMGERGWVGGGSCCFKSRGDNSEDAKSMEGSMKEMSF